MRNINRMNVRRRMHHNELGGIRYMNTERRTERNQVHNTLDTDYRRNGLLSSLCRDQSYPAVGIEELIGLE